jgi:hypothetical protein
MRLRAEQLRILLALLLIVCSCFSPTSCCGPTVLSIFVSMHRSRPRSLLRSRRRWRQESVVTGSPPTITLTADFDGSELFVFGAIRREGAPPEAPAPLDVIITIKGLARRCGCAARSRGFGIWINTDSVRVRQAPSFYAIATTRPLTTPDRDRALRHRSAWTRRFAGSAPPDPSDTSSSPTPRCGCASRTASTQLDDDVRLSRGHAVPEPHRDAGEPRRGDYAAEFFLVRDRRSSSSAPRSVEKTGIERWLFNLRATSRCSTASLSVPLALAPAG